MSIPPEVQALAAAEGDPGLEGLLDLLQQSFDLRGILSRQRSLDCIVPYFTQSLPAYLLCHSPRGSMHMALNPDGCFDASGYDAQARIVEQHVRATDARRVLELGCGKGFNLRALARRNSDVSCCGVDFTPWHVRAARLYGWRLRNLRVKRGDFHQLPFPDASFDVVFSVEAICHASDVYGRGARGQQPRLLSLPPRPAARRGL